MRKILRQVPHIEVIKLFGAPIFRCGNFVVLNVAYNNKSIDAIFAYKRYGRAHSAHVNTQPR